MVGHDDLIRNGPTGTHHRAGADHAPDGRGTPLEGPSGENDRVMHGRALIHAGAGLDDPEIGSPRFAERVLRDRKSGLKTVVRAQCREISVECAHRNAGRGVALKHADRVRMRGAAGVAL